VAEESLLGCFGISRATAGGPFFRRKKCCCRHERQHSFSDARRGGVYDQLSQRTS